MTEHSPNSQNGHEKKTQEKIERSKRIEQLEEHLGDKGWNVHRFASFVISHNEQIIGELPEDTCNTEMEALLGRDCIQILAPKRFIRIQQMSPSTGAITITTMLGGFDLLSDQGSHIWVKPLSGYKWRDQDDESYLALLTSFAEYLERQVIGRAEEAGLKLPGSVRPRM